MHLFLLASQDETYLKRITTRASELEEEEEEESSKSKPKTTTVWSVPEGSTARYDYLHAYIIHSPNRKHFCSKKAACLSCL